MKKVIILAALCLMGQSAWAQIRDFQTTRLMSTAGAGVASILSTEAAILNPASSAFFSGSSFSYQGYSTTLKDENELRKTANDDFPSNNRSQGAFLSDHSGAVKGGVAYLTQEENHYEREKMVLHGSAAMGASTAMGVSYNYVQDTLPNTYKDRHQTHHQLSLGMTHFVADDMILGIVILDPTRTNAGDERLIAGFQYTITNRFMLIGDVGTQYTKAWSDKYLWRAAVQLNIFSDFFIRVGQFYDNVTQFKGTGWGVSWMGPRLGVEFAQKYSDQIGDSNYIYEDESLVDTSLSAIIKF